MVKKADEFWVDSKDCQVRPRKRLYSDFEVSVTSKALWYVESHLNDDVRLETVAESVGVSRFHLARAFSAAIGKSLTGYARARRLTVAAGALTNGAPNTKSFTMSRLMILYLSG